MEATVVQKLPELIKASTSLDLEKKTKLIARLPVLNDQEKDLLIKTFENEKQIKQEIEEKYAKESLEVKRSYLNELNTLNHLAVKRAVDKIEANEMTQNETDLNQMISSLSIQKAPTKSNLKYILIFIVIALIGVFIAKYFSLI